MTEAEKARSPFHTTCGGYLKTYEYKEAWANFWIITPEENKKKFLNLPNFDATIFKDITGVDVGENQSRNGEIIELDGKRYRIREVENKEKIKSKATEWQTLWGR